MIHCTTEFPHKGLGCNSHVTKKTNMMCATRNTVTTMLLLGVWEVKVGEGGGGMEVKEG